MGMAGTWRLVPPLARAAGSVDRISIEWTQSSSASRSPRSCARGEMITAYRDRLESCHRWGRVNPIGSALGSRRKRRGGGHRRRTQADGVPPGVDHVRVGGNNDEQGSGEALPCGSEARGDGGGHGLPRFHRRAERIAKSPTGRLELAELAEQHEVTSYGDVLS